MTINDALRWYWVDSQGNRKEMHSRQDTQRKKWGGYEERRGILILATEKGGGQSGEQLISQGL